LADAGAAVDEVDNGRNTAIMHACCKGCHECAQALIDAQADLELTNRDRQNVLMVA
jgi:ankyrin repeat protein